MKFRLQALVHQSEPDELDIVPRLVRPPAVVASAVLGVVIIAVIVWSFVGNLPRRVSAQGVLTPVAGLNTILSTSSGVVQSVDVSQASAVTVGQNVVTVVDSSGKATPVTSPFAGTTLTISVVPGQQVQVGTPLSTVQPGSAKTSLDAVLFVPSSRASQLAPGMSVQMAVDNAPSAAFGLLRGKVKAVEPFPVTLGQAEGVLGNDLLAASLVKGGPTRLVHIVLEPDGSTVSGYRWTTKNGPPFPLFAQSTLNASVQVSTEHPITFVFGR